MVRSTQRAIPGLQMSDIDIVGALRKKVGHPFSYKIDSETEECTELDLTSRDYCFQGYIRHHSQSAKREILDLISRLQNVRYLNLRRCKLGFIPDSFGGLTQLQF